MKWRRPSPRLILLGFVSAVVGIGPFVYYSWSQAKQERTGLVAIAKRHGYDPDDYVENRRLDHKVGELKQPMSDAEWQTTMRFIRSKDPAFRQRTSALLRYEARVGRREESIRELRTLLNDPDQYVVMSSLFHLWHLKVPDRMQLAERYSQDSRKALSDGAKMLISSPPPEYKG